MQMHAETHRQADTETPAYPGTPHRHPGGGLGRAQGALVSDFAACWGDGGGTRSSWFLPLPSQDYFSNPIPQRPWEGGKEEGAMPLFGSLEG